LFQEAYPQTADRESVLGWARALYDLMKSDFRGYQRAVQAEPGYKPSHRTDSHRDIAASEPVLPPETNWTYYWLLYRYMGLNESSRAAALEHWRSCFPAERHEQVLAFGTKVAEERRTAGEPLPPATEVLPWLCAVERLTGTDPYGWRCRTALDREFDLTNSSRLRFGVLAGNPNDDFFYLEAAEDPLGLYPLHPGGSPWNRRAHRLGGSLLFIGVVLLGIHWVMTGLARLVLRGRRREVWDRHTAHRWRGWWLW
jgi:hypothetical protein